LVVLSRVLSCRIFFTDKQLSLLLHFQDPNDMFAAPPQLVARGVKRAAVSISPVPAAETITEGPVKLVTDIVFPLQKDEKAITPLNCASVNKAASQSCFASLGITTTSGSACMDENSNWILDGLSCSVEDGPNDASVLVHKELTSPSTNRADWVKKTAMAMFSDPVIQENWSRSCNSFDNDVASHQTKAHDPIYAVANFTLPFKVLKEIKPADILPIFDDDGTVNLHFHLWHADQSGRNTASINRVTKIQKQLCFDATRSHCTFATCLLAQHFHPFALCPSLQTSPTESTL